MKKCFVLAVLTVAALIGSASTSDAGPFKRFLDNRRARLHGQDRGPVTHPLAATRAVPCANGVCK